MMDKRQLRGKMAASMTLAVLALSACIDYTVETKLNPDGSGHRSIRVEGTDAHRLAEDSVTHEEFVEFMSLSRRQGWVHDVQLQADGDTTYLFTRTDTLSHLNAWSGLSDQIHIIGSRGSTSDERIGYVTLGDVQFRNVVQLRSGGLENGAATFSYQETFRWNQAVDVVMEFFVDEMDRSLVEGYPTLSERDRGEILGAARANLWAAVEDGLLDSIGEDEDVLWMRAMDRTVAQGIKVIRPRYPNATEEKLMGRLDLLSEEYVGDPLDRLNYLLPGLSAATNSEFKFYLTMPGRITTTNAHSRDGNQLIWEFNPIDAFTAPIVLVAESVVGG